MRQFFILFMATLLFPTSTLYGQKVEQFKQQLSQPDSVYRSRVEVIEHGSASVAVRSAAQPGTSEKIRGYRVCIFVDNGQHARNAAFSALARFREIFPNVPTQAPLYENPDFKVNVGNCFTLEEAIILKGKIQGAFDRAFVVRQEIPLALFGEKVTPPTPAPSNTHESTPLSTPPTL